MTDVRRDEILTLAAVSLGCPKNLVDSEVMLGRLAEYGVAITDDPSDADIILINTCGFLTQAMQESDEVIAEMAAYRQAGSCQRLVVVGCYAQRAGGTLLERFPEIDAVVGVNDRDLVVEAIFGSDDADSDQSDDGSIPVWVRAYERDARMPADTGRLRLTDRHWSYLRISEGCDQLCTFCTIPSIRGGYRSKYPETLLDEAHELAADGATELVLIGQETSSYGRDLSREYSLADLLNDLNGINGVRWIRVMYGYPATLSDEIIQAMADCSRVVPYLDIPLQHIADRVLRRMNRRIDRAGTEQLIARLRSAIPDIALRTTMLVGFPGETEDDFEQLLDFVRQVRFDALGAFAFSPEEGTPAASMADQVDEQVRMERLDRLMSLQQEIAFARAQEYVGRELEVVIDQAATADDPAVARHAGQAPEGDPVTLVHDTGRVEPGKVLTVAVEAANQYDLVARCNRVTVDRSRS